MHNWRLLRGLITGLLLVYACLGSQSTVSPDLTRHLQAAQTAVDSQNYEEAVRELRAALAMQPKLRGAHYQLGLALFQLHDLKEAEDAFTRELDFPPADPYSLYYLGRIRADLGQRAQSILFFEKSIEAGDVLDGRERLGSSYLAMGRVVDAVRFLQGSVKVRPEDGSLHYLLARAYKQQGRSAEAKIEYDAAARWKRKFREDMTSLSDFRSALAKHNQSEVESRIEGLAASKDSDILMACATALGQAGMHQQAIVFLRKTIAMSPNIPEAHYDLARAYMALDDSQSAGPELEKAVALKPGFYEAELLLGTLLVDEEKGDAAIPHLREAVNVRADNPKLLMMLGLQYYQRGYFADSIDVLKKAMALAPETPDPRYLLIEAYYRNFEYEHALNLAQDTATRLPDLAMSHYHLGAQLNNMGRVAEAKQELDLAVAKDPHLIEARAMLGDVLFKLGKPEESLVCFRTVLAANPGLMDAQAGLGKALIQLRRYSEAAEAMEKAIRIDPDLASPHLYLSQAYRGLSRVDEAKKEAAVFTQLNQKRAAARDREGDLKYPN
jgi:tetratricopeptide (TPR) repeat protein